VFTTILRNSTGCDCLRTDSPTLGLGKVVHIGERTVTHPVYLLLKYVKHDPLWLAFYPGGMVTRNITWCSTPDLKLFTPEGSESSQEPQLLLQLPTTSLGEN